MASNKYFQDLEIEVVEESDNYTKVVAEPSIEDMVLQLEIH